MLTLFQFEQSFHISPSLTTVVYSSRMFTTKPTLTRALLILQAGFQFQLEAVSLSWSSAHEWAFLELPRILK